MNELYESIFHAITEIDASCQLNNTADGQGTISNHIVRDLLIQARSTLISAAGHVWATGTGAPSHRRYQHPIETIDAASPRWQELVESNETEAF